MKWKVEISRSATRTLEIEVEGDTIKEARDKAYNICGGFDFSNGKEWDDVTYCVETVEKIDEGMEMDADWLFDQLSSSYAFCLLENIYKPHLVINDEGLDVWRLNSLEFYKKDIKSVIIKNGIVKITDIKGNLDGEEIIFLNQQSF